MGITTSTLLLASATTTMTLSIQPQKAVPGWSFLGCYAESAAGVIIREAGGVAYEYSHTEMTIDWCINKCDSLDGREDAIFYADLRAGSCYCGYSNTTVASGGIVSDQHCNSPCTGNVLYGLQQACGAGSNQLNPSRAPAFDQIYIFDKSNIVEPEPSQAPEPANFLEAA